MTLLCCVLGKSSVSGPLVGEGEGGREGARDKYLGKERGKKWKGGRRVLFLVLLCL